MIYLKKVNLKFLAIILVLLVIFIFQIVSRFLWTNHYYGSTNIIFFTGDSICYAFRTYAYAGYDLDFLDDMIIILQAQGDIIQRSQIMEIINSPSCGGIRARIMLPFLASFFVPWIGIHSVWVVPVFAWFILVMSCAFLLMRRGYYLGALVSGSMVISSAKITVWSVSAMTDSLLMLFVGISFLVTGIFDPKNTKTHYFICAMLILGAALTKQSWPFFVSSGIIYMLLWIRDRSTRENHLLFLGAIYVFCPLIFFGISNLIFGKQNGPEFFRDFNSLRREVFQSDKSVIDGTASSVIDKASLFERFFFDLLTGPIKVLAIEIQSILLIDTSVFILILLSIYSLFQKEFKTIKLIAITLLITGGIISFLNGTPFNFRFFLPAVGPLMLSSALIFKRDKNFRDKVSP